MVIDKKKKVINLFSNWQFSLFFFYKSISNFLKLV